MWKTSSSSEAVSGGKETHAAALLVEVHLAMHGHTADVQQHELAQRITDATATRARLDQEANCLTVALMELRSLL